MRAIFGDSVVESWSLDITPSQARAVCAALKRGETVELQQLMVRPNGSQYLVRAIPLLLQRGKERILLPDLHTPLQEGDHLLCCGHERARATMRHNLLGVGVPKGPEGKSLWMAPALPQKVLSERDPEDSEMGPLTQTELGAAQRRRLRLAACRAAPGGAAAAMRTSRVPERMCRSRWGNGISMPRWCSSSSSAHMRSAWAEPGRVVSTRSAHTTSS